VNSLKDLGPLNLKNILKKLDQVDLDILATIETLGVIPTVTSRRGVNPEEVKEKLKLDDKNCTDRLSALKKMGLLDISTGWFATITSNGLNLLEVARKSNMPDDNEKQAASNN
jgi:RIO-like serine/threonine protein kinase